MARSRTHTFNCCQLKPAVCPAPEPVVETEVVNQKDFTAMTKSELEEFGRTIGIELDKRHTKVRINF